MHTVFFDQLHTVSIAIPYPCNSFIMHTQFSWIIYTELAVFHAISVSCTHTWQYSFQFLYHVHTVFFLSFTHSWQNSLQFLHHIHSGQYSFSFLYHLHTAFFYQLHAQTRNTVNCVYIIKKLQGCRRYKDKGKYW